MSRSAFRMALAALVLLAATAGGDAQLPRPTAHDEVASVPRDASAESVLARDQGCREASNSCEVCVRTPQGEARCSTPGIACQPATWRCSSDRAGLPAPR